MRSGAQRTVVVLCAVEEEAVHLRRTLALTAVDTTVPGTRLRKTTGLLPKSNVVIELVVTRIGQAHAAAAATAVLLERSLRGAPPPSAVVSCGCAGAHVKSLNLGDVVVGTAVKPIGQVKVAPSGAILPKGFRDTCQSRTVLELPADKGLLETARSLAGVCSDDPPHNPRPHSVDSAPPPRAPPVSVPPEPEALRDEGARESESALLSTLVSDHTPRRCSADMPASAEKDAGLGGTTAARGAAARCSGWVGRTKVVFGSVGSTDTWNCHRDQLHSIHGVFGTLCEEMEAGAVAAVCAEYSVPFIAVKDIANNELKRDRGMTVPAASIDHETIGKAAAEVTVALLRRWGDEVDTEPPG
eukprot:m.431219 g.431219  ORF g.431219 m.431219 type:complete len:357 (+) comp17273_c0_seq1:24-1094(+)